MAAAERLRIPLALRLALGASVLAAIALAVAFGLQRWLLPAPWAAALAALAITVPLAVAWARHELAPLLAMFRALVGTVTSYRDGDFSFGLHWERNDEIADLVQAHNALGTVLREQRLGLVQRELLLDTMVQNTPVAMLLVQADGPIVFANIAARQLLNDGRRIEGLALDQLLRRTSASLREAMARGGDALFTVRHAGERDAEDEIYHLARRAFTLNGKRHELLLLRHLTAELRRQEVQTWKKVIRVISHELNNSLAPVASLAHSATELVRRGQVERLPEILATVEERARHLEGFIEGYARFAKLPAPRKAPLDWRPFLEALTLHVPFTVAGELPEHAVQADAAQLEQALLNLLKNAHESGSPPQQVQVAVRRSADAMAVEVLDRGAGMNEQVMSNALVPFYSTKRSGTGLGLALAREIAEAHGGRIALHNREGGGLAVTLILPL
ncbi:ATP-binding protein [Ramlibacter sp. XY19]|uniref:sensor histidine kinase n=1 Tax=Ramlibacter paludis TaxID=2908000 RepID=UPI0023DBBCA3|nr:ATP-binding protein [Ramlibacter paludis]MCG2595665.1 ATP-binding protein [Ramlibacter paludis]